MARAATHGKPCSYDSIISRKETMIHEAFAKGNA